MVTVLHQRTTDSNDTEGTTPAWPQHARRDGEVVDLRTDPSRSPAEAERTVPVRRRSVAGRTFGWLLAAAALAVVAVVAIANRTGDIGIDLVVDDGTLPLWGVIAGAAALGFAAGRFLRDDG